MIGESLEKYDQDKYFRGRATNALNKDKMSPLGPKSCSMWDGVLAPLPDDQQYYCPRYSTCRRNHRTHNFVMSTGVFNYHHKKTLFFQNYSYSVSEHNIYLRYSLHHHHHHLEKLSHQHFAAVCVWLNPVTSSLVK